jgi:CHAD domain-containing protein
MSTAPHPPRWPQIHLSMAATDGVEIERKFDVGEATQLPAFEGLADVASVGQAVEFELDAVYFDTEDFALASHRLTLRRRTGGEDAGWHLKTPLGPDARQEFREPLGSDAAAIPQRLLGLVRVHTRDRPLVPVVHLHTRRIVRHLRDAQGRILAEFCDDHVRADRLFPDPTSLSWREWEVELVDGDRSLLDAVQSMLESAGIALAPHVSKLARALGDSYPGEHARVPAAKRTSSAAQVLLSNLDGQVQTLWLQDPRVRQDEPESVHQLRIAARRIRSALTTYRSLVDSAAADRLRDELKWLGAVLGASRDLQVLGERLEAVIAAEPPELVVGPVSKRIGEQIGAELETSRLATLTALDDERYFRLLDSLDSLLASLATVDPDSEPRNFAVRIRKEGKRLRKLVRAARKADDGTPRDLALHEVRKSAKRLRYAVEVAAPTLPTSALRLAVAAGELQSILGDHQDSVVARAWLLRSATEAQVRGESAFSYGRLHAIEQSMAAQSEALFFRAWKRFPRRLPGKKSTR